MLRLTLPAVPYSGRNRLATVHALEGDRAAGSHLCHREVAPNCIPLSPDAAQGQCVRM
jgi:hypothetical protein